MKKINLKSNKGFTMTDLIVALLLFSILSGTIGTLMYNSFKTNLQTKLAENAERYAIQILEDIDKTSYDEIKNGIEDEYKDKFSLPDGIDIQLEVSDYKTDTYSSDLIKNIKLTVNYDLLGKTEKIIIERLKVREI